MGKRCFCPRCGEYSYEVLKTHSHCAGCFYSPDIDDHFEPAIPQWAMKGMPKESEVSLEAFHQEQARQIPITVTLALPLEGFPMAAAM